MGYLLVLLGGWKKVDPLIVKWVVSGRDEILNNMNGRIKWYRWLYPIGGGLLPMKLLVTL